MQQLLTDEIKKALPPRLGTEHEADPLVQVKFFTPDAGWTWYATEGWEEDGDYFFFGLVQGLEEELGYFVLSELEHNRGPLGMRIERDIHFEPTPLSQVRSTR